jgi:hypothetical protein
LIKASASDSPDETAFFHWQNTALLRRAGFMGIRIALLDRLRPALPESIIPFAQKIGFWIEKVSLLREISGLLIISARKPLLSQSQGGCNP